MSNVTFKCKQTGNTVTFRDAHDIDGMRKHPDYVEVTEQVQLLPVAEQSLHQEEQPTQRLVLEQSSASPVAKRGRPSKKG